MIEEKPKEPVIEQAGGDDPFPAEPAPSPKQKSLKNLKKGDNPGVGGFIPLMQQFPDEVRAEIDKSISYGCGTKQVQDLIKKMYHGPLSMPKANVLKKYIAQRRPVVARDLENRIATVQKDAEKQREIDSLRNIDVARLDLNDKKKLLLDLARANFQRVELLKEIQTTALDPRWENAITANMAAGQKAIEAVLKLEGLLGGESINSAIVFSLMSILNPLVRLAAEDTWGKERLPVFAQNLEKRFGTVTMEQLKAAALSRITEQKSQEVILNLPAGR